MKKILFHCSVSVVLCYSSLAARKKNQGATGHAGSGGQRCNMKPQKVVLRTELIGRTTSFLKAEVRPQVAASFATVFLMKAGR